MENQFTLDTPLGTLLELPQAKAVMDKYLPGVSSSPMLGMISGLTLNMALALPIMAQFGLTKEKAEAMLAELNKVVK